MMQRTIRILAAVVVLIASLAAAISCSGPEPTATPVPTAKPAAPAATAAPAAKPTTAPAPTAKPTAAPVPAKVYKFNLANTVPVAHPADAAAVEFQKQLTTRSGGQIQLTYYPTSQLYADKDMVEVIPKGTLEMGVANLDLWSGREAALSLLSGTMLFWDGSAHARKAFDDAVFRQLIEGVFEKMNVKYLGIFNADEVGLIAKREVHTLADWKGLKVRTYGELSAVAVEALGGKPTVVSAAEQYDALIKGVVEGSLTGPSSFVLRKLYEGAPMVMKSNLSPFSFALLMNLDVWKSLPPDLQKAVSDSAAAAEKSSLAAANQIIAKNWSDLDALAPKWNLKIYSLTDAEIKIFRDTAWPVQKDRLAKLSPDLSQKLINRVEALR